MNSFQRLFAASATMIGLAATLAFADQITLKNGDRVTGKIEKKDKDTLTIRTDLLGLVTVKWENVTSVESDAPLHVELPDGQTVTGKVETKDGSVQVATQSGTKQAPLSGVKTIRNDAAQREYDRYLKPGIADLWSGYADFGAALARGNAKTTTLTTAFTATRATNSDKIGLHFNQIYSTALANGVSNTTANAVRGGWTYDRDLRPRLFVKPVQ